MLKTISSFIKKIKPPGFSGLSIYDVTIFFWKGLMEGAITTRASSLAFNFFLAFFPSIIVLFTLIPYISIDGLQDTLLEIISVVLPPSTNEITFKSIEDIVNKLDPHSIYIPASAMYPNTTNGCSALTQVELSNGPEIKVLDFDTFRIKKNIKSCKI